MTKEEKPLRYGEAHYQATAAEYEGLSDNQLVDMLIRSSLRNPVSDEAAKMRIAVLVRMEE